MYSVYQVGSTHAAQPLSYDSLEDELQGVLRVSRQWLEQFPVDEPQRGNLVRLGHLTEDLIRAGDLSPAAMTTIRAFLCSCCHRLNAAQGQCSSPSLDRCLLLKEARR